MRQNRHLFYMPFIIIILFSTLVPLVRADPVPPVSSSGPSGPIESSSLTPVGPGEYEIFYDDGTSEDAWCWNAPPCYWAVRFNISTPLRYPLIVKEIRVPIQAFYRPLEFIIFDSDGSTALWSTVFGPTSDPSTTWYDVPCNEIVFDDFYVAVKYPGYGSTDTFLGYDTSSTSGHSYMGPPMTLLPGPIDIPGYGEAYFVSNYNWMIHVIVGQLPLPVGGSLEDNSLMANSVLPLLGLAPIALCAYLFLHEKTKRVTR